MIYKKTKKNVKVCRGLNLRIIKLKKAPAIKQVAPVELTGKVLRRITEDPNFTIKDFKKRYSLKHKK